MTTPQFVPYEMKTTRVEVTSYENKQIRGRIINPYLGKTVAFDNLMQLLLRLEALYDSLNYPQLGMEHRTFAQEDAKPDEPAEADSGGPVLASFLVSVMFRQRASWQGRLVWTEKELESQFRSTLELIFLMDSALSQTI